MSVTHGAGGPYPTMSVSAALLLATAIGVIGYFIGWQLRDGLADEMKSVLLQRIAICERAAIKALQ